MSDLVRGPVEVSATALRSAHPARGEGDDAAHGRDAPPATLELEDGTRWVGRSFGAARSAAGEVVFNTGMVGYPETLTDPSYAGQIVVLTYPLVGNYGVPLPDAPAEDAGGAGLPTTLEADRIQVAGLVVADYSWRYSHWNAGRSLSAWLRGDGAGVPAVTGVDTRSLTRALRERGSMLGRLLIGDDAAVGRGGSVAWRDPNKENLVAQVSPAEPTLHRPPGSAARSRRQRVVLVDTGAKFNIVHSLLRRGVEVLRVPHDFALAGERFDGLMLSNGPGDPGMAVATVEQVRWAIDKTVPVFGICLGNQLLARAIGAETYKLPYGHRGQNQPVVECGTDRCFVTSQNHGFAVDQTTLPADWRPWFENLNDRTNEGIRHAWAPFRSVQFHPEANPGPTDTAFLFEEFVRMMAR